MYYLSIREHVGTDFQQTSLNQGHIHYYYYLFTYRAVLQIKIIVIVCILL